MITPYVLGVDTWEGQLEIDEAAFWAGGVRLVLPRLNDMDGGHHRDSAFEKQWQEAERFVRGPYFVYNPWVSGLENFTFLADTAPSTMTFAGIDIEVRKPDYPASTYAYEVNKFLARFRKYWKPLIYSGVWFTECLSEWPTADLYWWARYLYYVYPPERQTVTWNYLRERLSGLNWLPGKAPGAVKLWQCSADRYILPGTSRALDINIWAGSYEELLAWANQAPRAECWAVSITRWARDNGYAGPDPEPAGFSQQATIAGLESQLRVYELESDRELE